MNSFRRPSSLLKERCNIARQPCPANSGEYVGGVSNSADKETFAFGTRPRATGCQAGQANGHLPGAAARVCLVAA
jgi:hypothetical protein